MKILMMLGVMLLTGLSGVYAQETPAQLVDVGITRAYIPQGFDSNDRSQIVIEGVFPNTCYRVGPYKTEIDESQKIISISQKAYLYSGPCLDVMVPYSQIINLGILKSDQYKISSEFDHKEFGLLPIKMAKGKRPDEFLYAPLADASIKHDSEGNVTLRVDCNFTSRCMTLKEVKVFEDGDHVVTVLPIAELVADIKCWESKPYNYSRTVSVPTMNGKAGRYMLNARSLNGQAVIKLFDL